MFFTKILFELGTAWWGGYGNCHFKRRFKLRKGKCQSKIKIGSTSSLCIVNSANLSLLPLGLFPLDPEISSLQIRCCHLMLVLWFKLLLGKPIATKQEVRYCDNSDLKINYASNGKKWVNGRAKGIHM